MKFCSFGDTIYNLDKFIGVEVIDNSNDFNDVISILFRFEGDYLHSNDEESTPYSFSIDISCRMLTSERISVKDIESAFEDDIHNVLELLASEFVEMFKEELMDIPFNENYMMDLGNMKRVILKDVEEKIKK